ncbi:MAG: hypothetical protein ACRBDL_06250 [Alphaproteobacteria bacterium]
MKGWDELFIPKTSPYSQRDATGERSVSLAKRFERSTKQLAERNNC